MANYIITDTSLSSIADAIRSKGNTTASLAFPSGFISAINDISVGGGENKEDEIITRTISSYTNNTIQVIGNYAFGFCSNLTTVSFLNATSIGDYAFAYCSNLTTISFPNATSIGDYTFGYCSNLTTISFPKVTYIEPHAFHACKKLTTISFPNLISIGSSAFYSCDQKLTTVSLPNVTSIYSYAFANCTSLTNASFPKAISIDNGTFSSCFKLISLFLFNSSIVTLGGSRAFQSTPIGGYSLKAGRFGSVFVPESLLTQYQSATNWTFISSRIVGLTASQIQELTS